MKLAQFSISIRKAAALAGVTGNPEVTPFFDHNNAGTPDEVKVKIGDVNITTGDMAYADSRTWQEINARK
jgi:hypothetical protein